MNEPGSECFGNELAELLYGKGAHASPIACLKDLGAEVASRRIEGYPHSILQIVGHVNYWMDYELRRISGERPVYPAHAEESWPSSGEGHEADWKREVARFSELLAELKTLAQSDSHFLQREVEASTPVHKRQASSVQAVLWQTLVHNSYHLGEIVLLRRALGCELDHAARDSW
jgi:uncharacterized damage-inducible protein DinB